MAQGLLQACAFYPGLNSAAQWVRLFTILNILFLQDATGTLGWKGTSARPARAACYMLCMHGTGCVENCSQVQQETTMT